MARNLLIPQLWFDADHVSGGAVDNAGTASRDNTAEREARPAVALSTIRGQLRPVPVGLPDGAVDADVLLRSPGGVDAARWCWRNHASGTYKGKQQASVLSNVRLLYSQTGSGNRISRPKLLPLASGQALLLYLVGNTGSGVGGASVSWRTWRKSARGYSAVAGWNAASSLTAYLQSVPPVIVGADAVQFPDTGEIAAFVLGYNGTRPILNRLSCAYGDDNSAPLPWSETDCKLPRTTVSALRSMAVELLPNNRIAMLIYEQGSGLTDGGLWRTYSDDRGVTWAPWELAGTFNQGDATGAPNFQVGGGVSIGRARTGALVAMAPCIGPDLSGTNLWPSVKSPRMRLLVSADGDTWNDCIRANGTKSSGSSVTFYQADALCEPGVNEGAVVMGDDGLVRLFGAIHGDSRGDVSTGIYDDIGLLTLAKPDITAADVGAPLTKGQVYTAALSSTQWIVTCSDIIEGRWNPTVGALLLNSVSPNVDRQCASFARIMSLNGASTGGTGSNNLDGTGGSAPVYRGAKQMDVISLGGSLLGVVVGEDTDVVTGGDTGRWSAFAFRTLNWCEQFELPGTNAKDSIASSFIRGRTYEIGYLPAASPERMGWTRTGTAGNVTLNTGTYGCKIDNSDGVATYESVSTLSGGAGENIFVRLGCIPGTGGSTAADRIAAWVQFTNGASYAGVKVRFTSTSFAVVDAAGSAIVTVTGLTLTNGIELVFRVTGINTVTDILYRVLDASDPDSDGVWTSALAGNATPNLTTAAGTTEFFKWGNQTTTPAVSTWQEIGFNRSRSGSPNVTALSLNAMTASAYPELRDDATIEVESTPEWDDGLRHGSRAPVATCEPSQILTASMAVRWLGAAGIATPPDAQDSWRVTGSFSCDATRVRKPPVSNIWRSIDGSVPAHILFDAGNDQMWRMDAIAFFKCNAPSLRVQFATSNSWGAPSVNILCDTTDACDIRRDVYRRDIAGGVVSVEGVDQRVLRLAGDSATPLTPHKYKSDDNRSWYVYASSTGKTARILDNDGIRLIVDRSMSGAGTPNGGHDSDYISIYADTIFFPLAGGVLTTTGYRWMRIRFGDAAGDDLPEGYQQCGLVIAGDLVPLSDPHPDWGWQESIIHARARTDSPSGYFDIAETGPARRAWTFQWDFLKGPKDRAGYATTPGNRAGWERIASALLRLNSGSEVAALLPDYGNTAQDSSSAFGFSTEKVYPVRFTGDPTQTQVVYELCRTDKLSEACKALAGARFEESL